MRLSITNITHTFKGLVKNFRSTNKIYFSEYSSSKQRADIARIRGKAIRAGELHIEK